MKGEDALLWTIDRDPVLRSTIVAVLVLDRSPAAEDVRSFFDELVAVVPRLHWRGRRPSVGFGIPGWTADPRFDLDQHVNRVTAPAPGSLRTVLLLAQAMGSTAFDRELPLWEALVVDGLEGGHAAIVVKVHHAVVDGIGGLSALLEVAQRRETTRPTHDGHRAGTGRDHAPAPGAGSAARRLLGSAARLATRPWDHATGLWHDLATVGRLVAPAPTPRSPLARGRGVLRHFAVLDLSLADLRRSAEQLGGTVNDVFVAGVLGGLERYHELHGAPVEELRGLIPVSIRAPGDVVGTNRFVPMRFLLPTALPDPAARVRRVHEILGQPVHDPALHLSDAVAAVLSRLPPAMSTALFGSLLKGGDFVATNVPGPPFAVWAAGAHVERIYAFSPPAGAACNVSLVTLGRRACLGINIDIAAIPDDTMLVDCMRAAFRELTHIGRAERALDG